MKPWFNTKQVMEKVILLLAVSLVLLSISVNALAPTVNSTHFLIYDLANAGSSYDQVLDNYLEQAYSLYTGLGMKMTPPCSGSQYTVYVVAQAQQTGEAGITDIQYNYNPSTGQIISSCTIEINITAGLSGDLLEHTAYHELVHVSQYAYVQYITIPQSYPWYIEADAEGTASYYTNQCPLAQSYFQYNQYEYDPYDYSGKPIINMYYYSAFVYWLIANGVGPSTIEENVFASSSVVVSWLDNYYVQYLLSLVHGQNLCGSTYYPSFQSVDMSGSMYSLSVSLQGLSAQYYEIQLPATGTIEITIGSGTVISNLQLNSEFMVTNTTLYMVLANPTTGSEDVTVTVQYVPHMGIKVVGGAYYVVSQKLNLELYITYQGSPVSGTAYVNGTAVAVSNGYATVSFTGITWGGTYTINATYNGESALTGITLDEPSMSIITPPQTLYLTSNSFGYMVVGVNNPNDVQVITTIMMSSPPSPANPFKPMIYFMPGNESVTLDPGQNSIRFYFMVNSTVVNGQGDVYLYVSPSTAESIVYSIVPIQVSIASVNYDISRNYTMVNVQASNIGSLTTGFPGLSGTVYVNYSTYTVATFSINIPSPNLTLSPQILEVAPPIG